jgi:hypothetical protein
MTSTIKDIQDRAVCVAEQIALMRRLGHYDCVEVLADKYREIMLELDANLTRPN